MMTWLTGCLFYLVSVCLAYVGSIDFNSPCEVAKYMAVFSGGFVPSCKPDGTFRPVQCYEQQCWCVDEATGDELDKTRTSLPLKPNCEFIAFGVTELDMVNVIAKEKDDDISLEPEMFMSRPAYRFSPSTAINTPMKNYLPPALWADFSILVTIRPEETDGGFLFAVMDRLESVVEFGVSLSPGENEYTQSINLWYSESKEQGSAIAAELLVPVMTDRWSRFAISVTDSSINLFVYCHNYSMSTISRSEERLKFSDDSLLLIGHAGSVIQQQFKGEIQELLITDDPSDAALQCDESFQRQRQESNIVDEFDGSGSLEDPDSEGDEEDEFSGDMTSFPSDHTILPLLDDPETAETLPPVMNTVTTAVFPMTTEYKAGENTPNEGLISAGSVEKRPDTGDLEMKEAEAPPVKGTLLNQYRREQGVIEQGEKGEKGNDGEPGLPGRHGINGIPGVMGEVGPQGMTGTKGEKGDAGIGVKGDRGDSGLSVKGDRGAPGPRGEPGESIVGPAGSPGQSFLDQLQEMERMDNQDISAHLGKLTAFIGPKGEPGSCTNITGPPGVDGTDGLQGLPGIPGRHGEPGQPGYQGLPGVEGERGEPGRKGDPGRIGNDGLRGEKGDHGATGIQGPPGEPGKLLAPDGSDLLLIPGPPGHPGPTGESGVPGLPGVRGPEGSSGEKGELGMPGRTGAQGLPGREGIAGLDGLPGVPGSRGKPGRAGQNGMKGEPGVGLPGPPGPPGKSYGKPYFGAGWFAENSDQEMGDLKDRAAGPKGEKGEPGAYEEITSDAIAKLIPELVKKGDKGEPGSSGSDSGCKTCIGFKGSRGFRGERGFTGKRGSRGNKGSSGSRGFPGRDGVPGVSGSPGESIRGPKGEAGSCTCSNGRGQKGNAGLNGASGLPGYASEEGLIGRPGKQGDKGDRGAPGIVTTTDGLITVAGPPGPPGPSGESIRGPPGQRGAPGLSGSVSGNNDAGYNHGYEKSDSGVLLFSSRDEMSRASLAIPMGTLAFVLEQQRLYLRVRLGWQTIQMGHIVPLLETELTNVIPMWMDAPAREIPQQEVVETQPMLRMFALNKPTSGDLGGIAGADRQCYRDATTSGVKGDFRAILTSRLQDIESIVFSKHRDLPVSNGKGEKLLDRWSSISDGKSELADNVPIYTFSGVDINTWSRRYFWHGARETGSVSIGGYCQAWTSSSARELGSSSEMISHQLLGRSRHTCDSQLAVLCIETNIQS